MICIKECKTRKVPGDTSFQVTFDYRREIVDAIKSFSGCVYDKNGNAWEVPILYLGELLDKLTLLDNIQLEVLKSSAADCVQDIKLSKYKTKPYPYQEEGIKYGLTHPKYMLTDVPGLGKSLQIIYLAQELKKREKLKHCLIICGINTLKGNWKREIERHSDLSYTVLGERINSKGRTVSGGVKERVAQLSRPIKEFFVITNIETLRSDEIIRVLTKGPNQFDMIALDEAHCVKNPAAQQTKNLLKLNKATHRIGATGTPLLNYPPDAYVLLKWLGVERSTFTTFRYFYCEYGGKFHNMLLGFKNLKLLQYQLDKYSLRRTKDLLDLPPKTVIEEYVEMEDRQRTFYENIKKGIVDEANKVEITTATLLSLVGRLRQITAYPGILTTENIPSAKIDRACDLVDQIVGNGEKVVIFSTFKETVKELTNRLSSYCPLIATGDIPDNLINERIVQFQNDPEARVFIGTHQKCGTGITLTAASYMIFIDTPWTMGAFQQACDRIHRVGTTKPVFIYHLITTGTIDERVRDILEDKSLIGEYIVDGKIPPNLVQRFRSMIVDAE